MWTWLLYKKRKMGIFLSLYINPTRYGMLNAYQQSNVTKFGAWTFPYNHSNVSIKMKQNFKKEVFCKMFR